MTLQQRKDALLSATLRSIPAWVRPNHLTVLRILLVPPFIAALLSGRTVWAALLFLFAALTDFIDGSLARLRHQSSMAGMVLDPIADKLLLIAAFLGTGPARITMPLLVAALMLELIILLGSLTLSLFAFTPKTKEGFSLTNPFGQWKTMLYSIGIFFALLVPTDAFRPFTDSLFVLGIFCAVASSLTYVRSYSRRHT